MAAGRQLRYPDNVVARIAARAKDGAKVLQAFALRESGHSQNKIGEMVGVDGKTVHRWFKEARDVVDMQGTVKAEVLTEDAIARMRADIATKAYHSGDSRTALEAMRDEARRLHIDVPVERVEHVHLVVSLSTMPAEQRRAEIQQRLAQLGLGGASGTGRGDSRTSPTGSSSGTKEDGPPGLSPGGGETN